MNAGAGADVHRRNISTVASPVILMFDGFHNIVYHLYLATRCVFEWSPSSLSNLIYFLQIPLFNGYSSATTSHCRDFKILRQKILKYRF